MSKLRKRLMLLTLTAVGGMLLVPAAGQGATSFGSRLLNEPTENTCKEIAPCTILSYIHPIDPEGEPYSGGAPVSGVITKFRYRAYAVEEPGQLTFRVGGFQADPGMGAASAVATIGGSGPTVTINPSEDPETPISEVGGRVPVSKGQHLAVDASKSIAIVYNSNGNKYSYVFSPPLVEGSGARGSTDSANELVVAATIEPDADGDGFGDETQDGCPSQASSQGACDNSKPGVKGLKVAGGRISYSLSEAATVSFKLEKKQVGRRLGKRCVRQTPKNKKRKRCPRYRRVGAVFSGPGGPGGHRISLPGGRRLRPGRYRLTMTASDAAGNQTTKTTAFSVVKKKKRKKG